MRLKQPLNAFYGHSVRCAYPKLEHGGEKGVMVWLRYRPYPSHHVSRIKGVLHLALIPCHRSTDVPKIKRGVVRQGTTLRVTLRQKVQGSFLFCKGDEDVCNPFL